MSEFIRSLLNATDEDEVLTSYPVFEDGARAVIFAVVPGEGSATDKFKALINRITQDPNWQALNDEV